MLGDLERLIHSETTQLPPLVLIALIRAQFETIHPFLDGNGRIGRLLITALLEHWHLLREPLLYLSGYLKRSQTEYYRLLSGTRTDGNWKAWVDFFLAGVAEAATESERNVIEVATLVATDRRQLLESPKAGSAAFRLFERLRMMPRFTVEKYVRNYRRAFQRRMPPSNCLKTSAS